MSRAPKSFSTILSFLFVGGIGTTCHYVILICLTEGLHLHAVLSSIIGATGGAMVNFAFNQVFTFAGRRSWDSSVRRYLIATAVVFLFNAAAMALLVRRFDVNYLVAQVATTIVAFFLSYLLSNFWVFRKHDLRNV